MIAWSRLDANDRERADRPVRVLIVDDDPRFAALVQTMLDKTDSVEAVGCAGDGAAAISRARVLRPDVVTMDLDMPVIDGVEATRRIVALGIHVVVVTGATSRERIAAATIAGASACISKLDVAETLVPLLCAVAHAVPEQAA